MGQARGTLCSSLWFHISNRNDVYIHSSNVFGGLSVRAYLKNRVYGSESGCTNSFEKGGSHDKMDELHIQRLCTDGALVWSQHSDSDFSEIR